MCTDAMIGWQRVVKGQPPTYVLGRVADGYQPPERSELGEMPEGDSKDVWTNASWLPFWNPESREVRIFHAANDGSRQAVANVVECYVTNCTARADQINYDPLTELAVDSYESKHGRRIYYPVFETVSWIERPAALQRVVPPPVKVLQLTAVPASPPEIGDPTQLTQRPGPAASGADAVETGTASKPPPPPPKAKRKTKAPDPQSDPMNDEIPW
jgi:hypothetical protein